jgi:hypothetical protein
MAMRVPKPATSGAAALGGEPFVPAQSGYFNLSYPTPPMKTFAGDMWAGQQMQKLGSALTSLGNKFQQEFDQNQLLQIEKDWYDFENQLMDPPAGSCRSSGQRHRDHRSDQPGDRGLQKGPRVWGHVQRGQACG